MAAGSAFATEGLAKRFGGVVATDHVSLDVPAGRAALHHRAERGRQVDPVLAAVRHLPAGRGPHPARRADVTALPPFRRVRLGSRPHLPDQPRLPCIWPCGRTWRPQPGRGRSARAGGHRALPLRRRPVRARPRQRRARARAAASPAAVARDRHGAGRGPVDPAARRADRRHVARRDDADRARAPAPQPVRA